MRSGRVSLGVAERAEPGLFPRNFSEAVQQVPCRPRQTIEPSDKKQVACPQHAQSAAQLSAICLRTPSHFTENLGGSRGRQLRHLRIDALPVS